MNALGLGQIIKVEMIWTHGSPPISGSRLNIKLLKGTINSHKQGRTIIVPINLIKVIAQIHTIDFWTMLDGCSMSYQALNQGLIVSQNNHETLFPRTLTQFEAYRRDRTIFIKIILTTVYGQAKTNLTILKPFVDMKSSILRIPDH